MAKGSFIKFLSLLITLFGLSILLSACSDNKKQAAFFPTYSLSGTVSGDIEQGVTIAVSGAVSASVPTDAGGNYSVTGLPNGSYTVTPSKPGYTFTAASSAVVISGANSTGNDFTAAAVPYSIEGTVSGATVTGVTISVTGTTEGGSAFTTSIDTTGSSYSVPNVPNGSYTVTPSEAGYSFAPVSIAVTISAGNASIAAFTSTADVTPTFDLTGTVTGDIKSGVTISVTGTASGSSVTGADGTYTIANLPNGTYTVTASKPGYTFSADLSPTIAGGDSNGNDFTATAVLYSISGAVTGDVLAGVTITISGTTEGGASFGPVEATSAGNGTYSVADVPNGDYTVAAARPGYLLNPVSYAVTISAGNSTGRDFTASTNPVVAFIASGGTGTTGSGGDGGGFYAASYGSIEVRRSGTVNALFTVPTITPDFGANPFVVSAGTTTVPIDDDSAGGLYTRSGDSYLYSGNGDLDTTNDAAVTGLTIPAGAILVLVDQGGGYGYLFLENDLVINGTLTSDISSDSGLYIEANLIYVETTGRILASALLQDSDAGEIYLGYGMGMTNTIINRGTIEAKGDGTGAGGYIYFQTDDLIANSGTIDASGGNSDFGSGGGGGVFEAYVDYGDFYSSGTVRINAGNGTVGGDTEYVSGNMGYGYSSWVETAYADNSRGRNGDIIISGTWEANGGAGASDNGGGGGSMSFQANAMGAITVNASMSVKGGRGEGAGSAGGSAGYIDFISYNNRTDNPTPGKISIAGTYDLRGGNGDDGGGNGGYLNVGSRGINSFGQGSDVEFVGFPVMVMNGGQGGTNGGSASNNAFGLYTMNNWMSSISMSITNEADIQARGGDSAQTGGTGGAIYLQTENPAVAEAVISNSGNIDVSGGNGDTVTGGSAFNFGDSIYMQAQHITTSGSLAANGGNGTTGSGGNGGNVTLISNDCALENTGTLSVVGGGGTPAGVDGATSTDSCSGGGPE